jgi:hypothetical protein
LPSPSPSAEGEPDARVGYWRLLRAAARRFLVLIAVVAGVTIACSALIGAIGGGNLGRSISLGLYLVGSLAVFGGVMIGSRGPSRSKNPRFESLIGPRLVRWATPEEQHQTLSDSAIFVTVGLVLILLGLLIDSRHTLF